jgi:hypothetical protein
VRFAEPAAPVPEKQPEEESPGVLFLDEFPSVPEQEEETPAPEVLAKGPANEAAYILLREKSATVADLSNNQLQEWEFQSWKPVKDTPPEFWVDLVAVRKSDAQEVHFIWSIDTETAQVRALSQAARDLESSRQEQ